jgi:PmbA protein
MKSTGNASRGLAGNPGSGAGNLFLVAGSATPEEILSGIPSGLYVTELLGQGVNMVTGDYSRGASGLWIENGQLTYPVQEITIAGNLQQMFQNITAIGDDLIFRGSVASPTIRIDGMTIAGE